MPDSFPFAVLNPGGRDKARIFSEGAGRPGSAGHPPVNYHGYAACMRGGFFRDLRELPSPVTALLVLLRRRHLAKALETVRALKKQGRRAFISWKESGLHQVAAALEDPRRISLFREVCREADGFLSSTADLVEFYRGSGCLRGIFLPTPYPVDHAAWDFSRPVEERRGVFIGTREFDVPSRNHLLAVTVAGSLDVPVTVVNLDGGKGERRLRAISESLNIVPGPLSYAEYLRLMASHRLVFQLDRSAVPGQVAGDAVLCGLPCVGGDGAIDRLAFPALCGWGREASQLRGLAAGLLADEEGYRRAAAQSREAAVPQIGFDAVARKLEEFLRA